MCLLQIGNPLSTRHKVRLRQNTATSDPRRLRVFTCPGLRLHRSYLRGVEDVLGWRRCRESRDAGRISLGSPRNDASSDLALPWLPLVRHVRCVAGLIPIRLMASRSPPCECGYTDRCEQVPHRYAGQTMTTPQRWYRMVRLCGQPLATKNLPSISIISITLHPTSYPASSGNHRQHVAGTHMLPARMPLPHPDYQTASFPRR